MSPGIQVHPTSNNQLKAWRSDLSDEEKLALVTLLTRDIAQDRRQSSARVRSLKQILLKLDPKPPAQPISPPKVSATRDAKHASVRQRG